MRRQRYIAVVPASRAIHPIETDDKWADGSRSDGFVRIPVESPLAIWGKPGFRALTLPDQSGAILGTVFERDDTKPLTDVPDWFLRLPPSDRPAALAKHFWGGFVALWRDNQDLVVSRDPSGAIACYQLRTGRNLLLFSDLDMVRARGLPVPPIDWSAMARHAMAVQYRAANTCLSGIHELPPGTTARYGSERSTAWQHWSPWTFGRTREHFATEDEATEALSRSVTQVHEGWSRLINRPLVPLSGGVDSSIVACALQSTPCQTRAITIATADPTGDEREFARVLTKRLGIMLHEAFFDIGRIRPDRSFAAALPLPSARSFAQELDRLTIEAAATTGADAILHGGGGDNVFCLLQSVTPVLDSLAMRGPGRRSARTLLDVCRLTGVGVPEVGGAVLRRLLRPRYRYRWPIDRSFLHPDTAVMTPSFDHPWLAPPRDALAGKAAHIAALIAIQNYLDSHFQHPELITIAPLMAQPIVEACLRIPTWMWISGGIDRAIARRAYANMLPAAIRGRRTKGSPDSVVIAVLEDRRAMVREFLIGGLLAAHKIVDTGKIDSLLQSRGPWPAEACTRLLTLCDMEAWARSVSGGTATYRC